MTRFSQPVPTRRCLWAILSLLVFIVIAVIPWIPVGKGEWSLWGLWLSLPDRDVWPDPFVPMRVVLFWAFCVGLFAVMVGWLGQAVICAVAAILAPRQSEPLAQANRSIG
jgi:hypothetical protein